MIATLRAPRGHAPRGHAQRVTRAAPARARARSTATARPRSEISWETRTFATTLGAIAAGFLLAVLYLGQITGLSATDYETQRLVTQRDELRRQSALLDVQLARLDAPARIETQAQRLGLVRLASIPVMPAPELQARR